MSWFFFKEVFLIHDNLVTQKISYFETIYQSHKRCTIFLNVLIFLNIQLIFLVLKFSSMLVESDYNLFVAKMFLMYRIITEKSLQRLTFQSVVSHAYIFNFMVFLILENKKYLFVFKRFPCVKWSFEASFWKKVAKKNVNKYWKIIK